MVDERIDKGVLLGFGHIERMGNNRVVKRVYVGACGYSLSRLTEEEVD